MAFSPTKAASADTDVATVTLGSGAATGEHSVEVKQLAKRQITSSTANFTNTTDTVADGGSVSFTVHGSATTVINVTSATSLSDLKDLINNQNSGVVASIVSDGTTQKQLVISSRQTGTGQGFVINNSLTNSTGTALAFASGQSTTSGNTQNAQNGEFLIDGVETNSASNSVIDSVAGITLTMLKPGVTSISLTSDDGVHRSMRRFVSEFNRLKDALDRLGSGSATISATDRVALGSSLRRVIKETRQSLDRTDSNGGRFKKLSEIGVEFTGSGKMRLDEDKLKSALSASRSHVGKLFHGAAGGNSGVFSRLSQRLGQGQGTAGFIFADESRSDLLIQSAPLRAKRQQFARAQAAAVRAIDALNKSSSFLGRLTLRVRPF